MAEVLEASALDQWQQQPILFIEQILRNPETGKPFELLDAERAFLAHAYQTDESGRLVYSEQLYACPKKSGKTGFAAMHLLTTTRLLMFWSHLPIAPSSFVDMTARDRCVDSRLGHAVSDRNLSIWVGVDASIKRDSTAIVAVTWDQKAQKVRLATHRVFQPNEQERLDFEAAVEGTLLDLRKRFWLRKVLFDPWRMQATAQRLTRAGLQLEEFPQSPGNLTTASQNLFELIEGQNLVAYPDAAIRLAMSRAIALETPRGWRISKEKAAHKIDVVVALAMAAYTAVKGQTEDTYVHAYSRWL